MFSYRTVLAITLAIVFSFLYGASPLFCQSAKGSDDAVRNEFENRLNTAIRIMGARVDSENAELNDRIHWMNAAAPLETAHLDSASVTTNISKILEFINYLTQARATSDTISRNFEDSLYMIKDQIPPQINIAALRRVGLAYQEDRGAFNGYLDQLNKLYSDVLDVLTFLQHSKYTLGKDKFTFDSQGDRIEYQKRMKTINDDVTDLNKASETMQKANQDANKQLKTPLTDQDQ
ncbi:MAG TPA: hypothetical protein VGM92_06470 [Candidatus Kapabacteria bacterium]